MCVGGRRVQAERLLGLHTEVTSVGPRNVCLE